MRRAVCHPQRQNFANGWCHTCYQQQYKLHKVAPDPLDTKLEHVSGPVKRVMEKVRADNAKLGIDYEAEMTAARARYRKKQAALKPAVNRIVETMRFEPWRVPKRERDKRAREAADEA